MREPTPKAGNPEGVQEADKHVRLSTPSPTAPKSFHADEFLELRPQQKIYMLPHHVEMGPAQKRAYEVTDAFARVGD